MTAPTFRLLDGQVGWDPRPSDGLAGVVLDSGRLRLAAVDPEPVVPRRRSGPWAALARSRDGSWWLAGDCGLRRLGPCDTAFAAWGETRRVRAIATRGRRVALVLTFGLVESFDIESGRLLAEARVPGAATVRIGPNGRLFVTDRHGLVTELDPSGLLCRAEECRPGQALPAAPEQRPAVPPGVIAGEAGFCLPGRGCFDWRGERLSSDEVGPTGIQYRQQGQFLSLALDSGIPGCQWHRIRIDAEIPDGTQMEAAFATTDGPATGRTPAAAAPGAWSGFPAGDPHPQDWFTLPARALDSTLRAAAGRYGYLRLRLAGDGTDTPIVHQVRLDLPRATSLEFLPAVYAEDPIARDFTERFVSIFDAQLESIDEVLARRAALLDAESLPDDALGWLAGLLGTGFEAEMPVSRRRELLRAAPDLFRRRGTHGGVVGTVQIALGITCSIEELGIARPWGAIGSAQLGLVRLYSSSTARFRLGISRLGKSRMEPEGNPDHDAILSGAHRIRVHVPAGTNAELVQRVVRSQIPANVAADVVVGTAGFSTSSLRLGISTVLLAPEPAVVGAVALGLRGVVDGGRAAGAEHVVGGLIYRGVGEAEGME